MNRILYLTVILLLSSCVTQKRCLQKFPPEVVVLRTDTLIYRDTIIYIPIEGDTSYVEDPWIDDEPWIEPQKINIGPIRADVPLAHSQAGVTDNVLWMRLIQRDSVLRFKIDSAIREHSDTITITSTVVGGANKTQVA